MSKMTESLDREAKALFKQLSQQIPDTDYPLLVSYCRAWSEFKKACATLDNQGYYLTHPNGVEYLHPANRLQKEASALMARLAKQLGFSGAVTTQDEWKEFR